MKNLHKKIGAIALAGAVLMGGVFASSKSFVYANGSSSYLNELSYRLKFEVINEDFRWSGFDLEEASRFLGEFGLSRVGQIKRIDSSELEKGGLRRGMYLVDYYYKKVLIGVRLDMK